jgi:Ser/Thr protein kinase RdoA (MazF antagonist)
MLSAHDTWEAVMMTTFVGQLVHEVYGFHAQSIHSLQTQSLDWRDLVYLEDPQERAYLLRLLRLPDAAQDMTHTAHVLTWLEHNAYRAPQLVRTRKGASVGAYATWSSLLLSFIPGERVEPNTAQLERLGHTLGQLHALPLGIDASFRQSRCHPTYLSQTTYQHLAAAGLETMPPHHTLIDTLFRTTNALLMLTDIVCLTHGDCWYANAILTPAGSVTLIDWDQTGMGLPLLEIGYLLLSSHFRLADPLMIQADQEKIAAILHGYWSARPIKRVRLGQLLSAVRFPLAFQVGEYVAQHDTLAADDPILQKLSVRLAATEAIAELAYQELEKMWE